MKKIFILFLLALTLVFTGNTNSQSNALLEYATGTWCGYCPCGATIANNIQTIRPNTLVLAYHGPSTSADPFKDFNGNGIIGLLGFTGYPTGVVGRQSGVLSRGSWAGWVNVTSGNEPGVSYNVTKNYNPTTRQLQVTANVTSLRNIDTAVYISLVLYEDNIVYPQNYYADCGTPGYHNDYVHMRVVRNMVNGATGELLKASPWTANTVQSKSWTTTLDNAWSAANVKVAIFTYLQGPSLAASSPVQQTWKEPLILTGVGNQQVPSEFSLSQNYPNPFNPTTNVKFTLPKDGEASLKIYDVVGNEVATYLEGFVKAGEYNASIDASKWSSGVYFYTLSTKEFTETKKMMLIK